MNYKPNWSGDYHFLMDATDASRICKGDSGGPGARRVAVGLRDGGRSQHVDQIDDPDDKCAMAGGKQRAVRIQHKVRWIDDMIGGDDQDDCTAFNDNGWSYERCW